MQEQKGKRPILSIKHKRKPSLMYQKPPQKPDSPDSEQKRNAAQPEQATTASSTKAKPKAKPKYKGLPGWDEVKDRFAAHYYKILIEALR